MEDSKVLVEICPGKKFDVDPHLVCLILLLNEAGFVTKTCCSGLWREHKNQMLACRKFIVDGYVSFDVDKMDEAKMALIVAAAARNDMPVSQKDERGERILMVRTPKLYQKLLSGLCLRMNNRILKLTSSYRKDWIEAMGRSNFRRYDDHVAEVWSRFAQYVFGDR